MQQPLAPSHALATGIGVPDWIGFHSRYRPNAKAFHSADSGQSFTYLEVHQRIDRLAHWLRTSAGVKKGDRVMLLSRVTVEAFEVQFACARLGAIFVPVNWRLSINELEKIADDAQPAVLIYQKEFRDAARALGSRENCSSLAFDDKAASSWSEGIGSEEHVEIVPEELDWESIWTILYTSGTTGKPKGVMISYRMMYFNVLNFIPVSGVSFNSVFLCAMPIFHTGGLSCYANPVLYCGGTVVVMADFKPEAALDLLIDTRLNITHFFGVPAIYLMIAESERFQTARFAKLEVAGLGGAPATESLVARWLSKGVPLQPSYGMTEIGPAIAISNADQVAGKLRSSGHPVMNMEVRIADEHNRPVAPGEVGELQVKGPVVMSGYWNDPKRTEETFVDGWFRTGDVARLDAEGCLYIVDRYKDLYISGGENVYPTEVENAISKHPAVLQVAVIGVEDPKWGEVGKAFVVLKPGRELAAEALNDHLKDLLASYKRPKHYRFVPELPATSSGKVKKQDLPRALDD